MLSKEEYIKKYGDFELAEQDGVEECGYKWIHCKEQYLGKLDITFDDGKTILSLWEDFPHNFTQEQIDAFMKVDRYWQNRFRSRSKD